MFVRKKKGRPERDVPIYGFGKTIRLSRVPKPDGQGRSGSGWSLHRQLHPPEHQRRRPEGRPTGQRQHQCRRPKGHGHWWLCHTPRASPWQTELLQALSFSGSFCASIEKTAPENEGSRAESQLGGIREPACASSQATD